MALFTLANDGTTLSLAKVGTTSTLSLPMVQSIFQASGVSLLVNFSSGAVANAYVDVSNDPLAVTTPASALWNPHDVIKNVTASINSSIVYPVYGLRLRLSAWTSGTVTLQVGTYNYQF